MYVIYILCIYFVNYNVHLEKFFYSAQLFRSNNLVVPGFRDYYTTLLLQFCFVWHKGNHTHQAILARHMGSTCIFKYSSPHGLNFHNDDFFTLFVIFMLSSLK